MPIVPQAAQIHIYALIDPITEQIRYIGKTKRMEQRRREHIERAPKDKTHRSYWIRQLLDRGLLPAIRSLAITTEAEWCNAEREWIAKGRVLEWPLTNLTLGGNGGYGAFRGRTHSDETKEKLRKASTGVKPSKESIEKRASQMRGRKRPPELMKRIGAMKKGVKQKAHVVKAMRDGLGEWLKSLTDEQKKELNEKKTASRRGKKRPIEDMQKMAITRRKLTNEQAKEIREMCASGTRQEDAAVIYNVSSHTIWKIVNRGHKYAYNEE